VEVAFDLISAAGAQALGIGDYSISTASASLGASFYIAAASSWPQLCVSRWSGRYNRSRSRLRPSVRTFASGAIALIPACSAARFS
jgi:hypothetical protein